MLSRIQWYRMSMSFLGLFGEADGGRVVVMMGVADCG